MIETTRNNVINIIRSEYCRMVLETRNDLSKAQKKRLTELGRLKKMFGLEKKPQAPRSQEVDPDEVTAKNPTETQPSMKKVNIVRGEREPYKKHKQQHGLAEMRKEIKEIELNEFIVHLELENLKG